MQFQMRRLKKPWSSKKKPKPKPQIDYPPVPTKKWIPPDERPKKPRQAPAYQKPRGITQKLAISSLNKTWHAFYVYRTTAVLAGSFSQVSKRFGCSTNGFQGASNCMVAVAFSKIYSMPEWKSEYIDRILQLGNTLYLSSVKQLKKPKQHINVPDVYRSFYFEENHIQINVGEEIHGFMFSYRENPPSFPKAMKKFFGGNTSCIATTQGRFWAIWCADKAFYVFDPLEHNADGTGYAGIPGNGQAIVIRFTNFDKMLGWIETNTNSKFNSTFAIYPCSLLRMVKVDTQPPDSLEELPHPGKKESKVSLDDEVVEKPSPPPPEIVSITSSQKPPDSAENILEYSPGVEPGELDSQVETKPVPEMPESKVPPEIPLKADVSYYLELIPNILGILRGGFHQGVKKLFANSAGKQSVANALAALVMLRAHKSKEWVPKIVDDILYKGQELYDDYRASIVEGEQACRLSDLPKKIELEDKYFEPDIEEVSVVGCLQSVKDDVFDLVPALQEFFSDNECGVISGPLVVAVWLEDGIYYMMDPEERDPKGLVIPENHRKGVKPRGSVTVKAESPEPTTGETGAACVMWFKRLKDLGEVYLYNVDRSMKRDPFIISRVQVNDYITLPDPWGNFTGVGVNKWILRGTFSQNNKRFSPESRNTQCTANATVALAYSALQPEKEWSSDTVDRVLLAGDSLYNSCVAYLKECNKFYDPMLLVDEIQRKFGLEDKEINLEIQDCLVNGIVGAKDDHQALNLKKGFEEFFKQNEHGVLTASSISVAVWKKGEIYYYYDSHSRDEKGLVNNFGTACVLRILNIEDLARSVEANLGPDVQDMYNISRVEVKVWEQSDDGVIRPPLNEYTEVDIGVAILRAFNHMGSEDYELNKGKQAVPMCLMALGMSKVYPPAVWKKELLDEIMKLGDALFVNTMKELERNEVPEERMDDFEGDALGEEESVKDADEIENPVTIENALKTFRVGLNRMDVTLGDQVDGVFKNELREAIDNNFAIDPSIPVDEDDHRYAIIVTEGMTLVVWRDNGIYYLFDPNARDAEGKVFGSDEWSEAHTISADEEEEEDEDEGGENEEGEKEERDEGSLEDLKLETPKEEPLDTIEEEGEHGEGEHRVEEFLPDYDVAEMYEEEEDDAELMARLRQIALNEKLERLAFWELEGQTHGKACAMFFSDLGRMIDHIEGLIPPNNRADSRFILYPLMMLNTPEVKDVFDPTVSDRPDYYAGDWYSFKEIEHGRWILRGTMNLNNRMLPEFNRGKQQVACCYAALAFAKIYHASKYFPNTVNVIVQYGDRLYTYTMRARVQLLQQNKDLGLTASDINMIVGRERYGIEELVRKFGIQDHQIEITNVEPVISGDITAVDHETILDVKRGLEKYFEGYPRLILLTAKALWVAVWRSSKTYFMFDPNPRGPSGLQSPDEGACITRYLSLGSLADVFLKNLPRDASGGSNKFEIYRVSIKTTDFVRERQPEPEQMIVTSTDTYAPICPGKWILRGTINEDDPIFAREPDDLMPCISMVALAMTLVHKCRQWSKPIIDEVVRIGNDLYELSQDTLGFDFNPWEQKLTLPLVRTDFKIGRLKANCELRSKDQRGIIDIKNSEVPNLRQGLERFFEENSHGVLQTDTMTIGIWEDETDELIYMFDPRPRGPNGLAAEENGVACLMAFSNAKVAFDHILDCLADPQLWTGAFVITPVDIIVADSKTKQKTSTRKRKLTEKEREEKRKRREEAERERKRRQDKKQMMLGRDGYLDLGNGKALLRGMRSQASEVYTEKSRNLQDIPNCVVAYVLSRLQTVDSWHHKHVDMVLDVGEMLYIDSYVMYRPVDPKLGLKNIMRKFFFKDIQVHVGIYKPFIEDLFLAPNLDCALTNVFQQENFCLLEAVDKMVAIFFKGGLYYVFYPRDIDMKGCRTEEGTAWAGAVRYDSIKDIVDGVILYMIDDPNEEVGNFSMTTMCIKSAVKKSYS